MKLEAMTIHATVELRRPQTDLHKVPHLLIALLVVRDQPRLVPEDVPELLFGQESLEILGVVFLDHNFHDQGPEAPQACELVEQRLITDAVWSRGLLVAVVENHEAGVSDGLVVGEVCERFQPERDRV